jgi:membrane associated rhomboid family serine protease
MPISVESHVGGFVAGAVAGAVLSRYAAPDEPQPPPDDYPG